VSYDSKPRQSRGYGGVPDGAYGAPSFGGGSSAPPASNAPAVDAVVKWFKADKGYGFVELAGGQGDAFLHANTLNQSGHSAVSPGATPMNTPRPSHNSHFAFIVTTRTRPTITSAAEAVRTARGP